MLKLPYCCIGTFTLTPSSVSVCPDQMVILTCSSTESTFTSHRWSTRVPGCDQLQLVVREQTPADAISGTAIGTNNCPSGIQFQATGVSSSPFVSTLMTTTAPDGTDIDCGNIAGTSSDVRISIKGNLLQLCKCVIQYEFQINLLSLNFIFFSASGSMWWSDDV